MCYYVFKTISRFYKIVVFVNLKQILAYLTNENMKLTLYTTIKYALLFATLFFSSFTFYMINFQQHRHVHQFNLSLHTIEVTRNITSSTNVKAARRLPSVIIIGAKKCGTRALLEYLRLHSDIKTAGPEPHFFDRYYHLGLEWYR